MKANHPLIRSMLNLCYRPVLMVLALGVLLAGSPARATLYLTEPFSYPAGALGVSPANGTWDTTAKSAINVTATGLTGPAGFPAAAGNDITIGNTGHNQQNFNTFTSSGTIVSGTVYACFLLKVTSSGSMRSADTTTSPNYNDAFTLALQNATSAASPFCSVRMINSSGIKIGLAKNGAAGVYRTAAITANTTYMVVVKYDFSTTPNTANLWILSTYQGTEAGAGAADVTITTGTDLAPGAAGLGQCYLSDAAGGTFQVDELRIASTWAEATGGAPAGPATKLAFTTQPASAAPGATMNAVVVQAQDTGGQAVATNNIPITLTLSSGSGTLSGTVTQNTDSSGKATFSNLSIDQVGAKQLTAAASGIGAGLASATSSSFNIAVPVLGAQLAFTIQPSDVNVSATMTPAVVVQIQDPNGVAVNSNNVPITLTLSAGTGLMNGTTTRNTDATGKATFNDLTFSIAGSGKQITATSSGIGTGLTNAVSFAFIVNPAGSGSSGNLLITGSQNLPTGYKVQGTNSGAGAFTQILGANRVDEPLTNWVIVSYQNADGTGSTTFTNPVSPAMPAAYYRLRTGDTTTKLQPPSIGTAPQSQIVSPGATATFTVVASGPMLQYLWFFNGNPISGATNSSLVIPNAQNVNAGNYTVAVANPAGNVTSAIATLGVGNVAPTITAQPQNQSVSEGGSAIFNVTATGTSPLNYQWYYNNSTPLSGQTNAQLLLNNVANSDTGNYRCTVTNGFGSATSSNASLAISPVPTDPPVTNLLGWAAYHNVTGGSGGTETTVNTYAALRAACRQAGPIIIKVDGILVPNEPYCYIEGSDKTIIGIGTNSGLAGYGFRAAGTNLIIANMSFNSTNSNSDGVTIDNSSHGTGRDIWVDHCSFYDCTDGSVDITKGADYVTVSWCKFHYAPVPKGTVNHEFVDLIGSSDSDNAANYHVTFHHNWYAEYCRERMPSVRFGRVHVFNNYYSCFDNNYCVRTRIDAEVLVENNYFIDVQNPWERFDTSGTPGKLKASGNITNNCTFVSGWVTGAVVIPGNDTLGSELNPPPYTYSLTPANDVPYYSQTYAGHGKYPYYP